VFVGVASLIILLWLIGHLIGGHVARANMDPITFFDESGTMGTLLVLVVYFLSNLALPFYYRKFRPAEFNVIKHAILPVLGMIAIAIPVYYLCKPPQPAPYDWFPWAGLGVIVVSILYALFLTRRDPGIGDRVGSIVADE
jgi:amino acid transporter